LCNWKVGLPGPRRVGFKRKCQEPLEKGKLCPHKKMRVEVESDAETEGSGIGGWIAWRKKMNSLGRKMGT